jgi:hypothetical protein
MLKFKIKNPGTVVIPGSKNNFILDYMYSITLYMSLAI